MRTSHHQDIWKKRGQPILEHDSQRPACGNLCCVEVIVLGQNNFNEDCHDCSRPSNPSHVTQQRACVGATKRSAESRGCKRSIHPSTFLSRETFLAFGLAREKTSQILMGTMDPHFCALLLLGAHFDV